MRLVDPTDFEILQFLAERGRNNAVNLSAALDLDRAYVNTRLRVLAENGLARRVGPAPNSGLYEITKKGERALAHRDRHGDAKVDFESLIEE
ncbi:MAG: winged helix-turn-helix domain-containing protein [Halobacteriaceae archaeon]